MNASFFTLYNLMYVYFDFNSFQEMETYITYIAPNYVDELTLRSKLCMTFACLFI